MKKVVIIGGGFAGAAAAKELERCPNIRTILIDTKDYFEFTPSVLRTIVEPEHMKAINSRHSNYLKKTKIIVGNVTSVSKKDVTVRKTKDTKKIAFDYLVICSGSRYDSPMKEENLVVETRASHLKKYYDKLLRAKNILIIGGGPVGTELAAEVAALCKGKKITLVHSRDELIERSNKSAREYAAKQLEKLGVSFLFNSRIVRREEKNYVTEDGKKIPADLVFMCVGMTPNGEFLKKNFSESLNEKNQLIVNSNQQIKGHKNIFAAGDITAIAEEKLAQNAEKQGEIAGKNIRRIIESKELEEYISKPRVMVISLGKWDGILTYKNFSLKGLVAGVLKGLIEWKTMISHGKLK